MQIGLIIGRFQPFHKGHLYLIKKALRRVEKLIIGIGSSNIKDKDNPLSYFQRKKMIELVFEKEGIKEKLLKIVSIPDTPDDDEWLRITLKRVGKFDVSIGNNEWTNGIFEEAGFSVLRLPLLKRSLYEGVKIRKALAQGKKWERKVPPYLIPYLEEFTRL